MQQDAVADWAVEEVAAESWARQHAAVRNLVTCILELSVEKRMHTEEEWFGVEESWLKFCGHKALVLNEEKVHSSIDPLLIEWTTPMYAF